MMIGLTRSALAFIAVLAMISSTPPAVAQVKPRNAQERTVIGLLDMAFNLKRPADAFALYGGPYYRQHNPTAPDGKEAIVALLGGWLPTVPNLRYDIKRIVSHGDMVWVHSHVTFGPQDRGQAVVDIFRLERGKIVEHWDVGTAVPEKALNDNTMF
jgi:predicted SnoaL-like aldol condensation-catalyzing enzyme